MSCEAASCAFETVVGLAFIAFCSFLCWNIFRSGATHVRQTVLCDHEWRVKSREWETVDENRVYAYCPKCRSHDWQRYRRGQRIGLFD